jgi:GTPase SAR1 family protein
MRADTKQRVRQVVATAGCMIFGWLAGWLTGSWVVFLVATGLLLLHFRREVIPSLHLTTPWSRVTCPFCFERFHLVDAPRRSIAPNAPLYPDREVAHFLGEDERAAPLLREVLRPPQGFWVRLWLRFVVMNEWAKNLKKICPRCHLDLPHSIATGQSTGDIIAIIGIKNSGKSNYIGVLLHDLREMYGRELGFQLYAEQTFDVATLSSVSSERLYNERYGQYLFQDSKPRVVPFSPRAALDRGIRVPLIYRVQFRRGLLSYLMRPGGDFRAVQLVLFDTAGEDLKELDTIDQYKRYLTHAAGLVFIVDPLELPGFRDRLRPDIQERLGCTAVRTSGKPNEVTVDGMSSTTIIENAIDLLQRRGNVPIDHKIQTPVAVAVSKCDLFQYLTEGPGPSSALLLPNPHTNGFDVEDCERCSHEMAYWLDEWGGRVLVDNIRGRFESCCFFATASFGDIPEPTGEINNFTRRRIGDPLLWLFWKLGYLPAKGWLRDWRLL